MQKSYPIRRAAVLGAGVMGAQIAAHLVNAGVPTLLFELPGKTYGNENVDAALKRLTKLKPTPLGTPAIASKVQGANYDEHLGELADCDLVIEAIAERMDWKKDLYEKVAPHLSERVIFASNTSGLGITSLSEALPAQLRPHFLGVHFFNPPRYMHLAELIPTAATDPALVDALEAFLTTTLGKGVVRAKDTPNFIGNRIGVFSMLATMKHTAAFGLGLDTVDALTGPAIGRPKSATYRTADVVGLDTMAHVIGTMANTLPDDPWREHFDAPDWLQGLIKQGALGQKTGAGCYRKVGKDIQVLDPQAGDYRPSDYTVSDEVQQILAIKDPREKFAKLRASDDVQAQFLWAMFRDLFHYSAYHLQSIADTARDVDFAIRWGYGWVLGPFETWQAADWQQVAKWIADDIDAGKAMSDAALPAWVTQLEHGPHHPGTSYSPAAKDFIGRSELPVYQRQAYPEPLITDRAEYGQTVFETEPVRVWTHGDDIAIASFKTKKNTISSAVLDGLQQAVATAENDFAGLVIWQTSEPFSLGADLSDAVPALQGGKADAFEAMLKNFQDTSMRLKYSLVPVVAGVRGMALGGSCEFIMHTDATCAAFESYIGLPEAGVGLLPGGGGLKEAAVRVDAAMQQGEDLFPLIQKWFERAAMAKVAGSALEAQSWGILRPTDQIVMHGHEVLNAAKEKVRHLAAMGYRPPLPGRQVRVAGRVGVASLEMMLVNMLEGRFISEHDYEIARRIAMVLCGGDVERDSLVDEQWLLDLERAHFMALAMTEKSQARIMHTLKTGKPLRN